MCSRHGKEVAYSVTVYRDGDDTFLDWRICLSVSILFVRVLLDLRSFLFQ